LKRQDLSHDDLARYAPEAFAGLPAEELAILETRSRYEGYIRREQDRLERLKPLESRRIPEGFVYRDIPGLSREVVEKCSRRRPRTVGEAGRIPGVTPAAVAIICAHAARERANETSSP
jgi:tRNA uridine 5-carboxymethylaminomethyl modification enzyme